MLAGKLLLVLRQSVNSRWGQPTWNHPEQGSSETAPSFLTDLENHRPGRKHGLCLAPPGSPLSPFSSEISPLSSKRESSLGLWKVPAGQRRASGTFLAPVSVAEPRETTCKSLHAPTRACFSREASACVAQEYTTAAFGA